MGFGFMEGMFSVMFPLVFIAVIGIFITVFVRSLSTWSKNNKSPRISVNARIVSKRSHVYGGMNDISASTSYYATFEFDTGDRMELHIPYSEYGLLAEGDKGVLVFQGTRFLSFERSSAE